MGTKTDTAQRKAKARVDSEDTQEWLADARDCIFVQGLSPDSTAVEDLLDVQSLLPTRVCCSSHCRRHNVLCTITGRILCAFR